MNISLVYTLTVNINLSAPL